MRLDSVIEFQILCKGEFCFESVQLTFKSFYNFFEFLKKTLYKLYFKDSSSTLKRMKETRLEEYNFEREN